MNYIQIQPPDPLKKYIRYCWALEGSDEYVSSTAIRTMADGCPGIIFQNNAYGTFYQNTKKLPDVVLYGQSTTYSELNLNGHFNTIGIYFYPHALKSIFGCDADELTNSCLDLNNLAQKHGFSLSEMLSNTPGAKEQLQILFDYLLLEIHRNDKLIDNVVDYALFKMVQSGGTVSLKEIQAYLNLSERGLERKFKTYVGISPKLFSRICRFQSSLHQLRSNSYNRFTDVAFEQEYADQSHFIRSFKEFAGLSPLQYQKQSQEIVENFSQLIA